LIASGFDLDRFAQKVILWEASPTPISLSFTLWQQWQAAIAVRDRSHRLFMQSRSRSWALMRPSRAAEQLRGLNSRTTNDQFGRTPASTTH
jgi:hypothetical protein